MADLNPCCVRAIHTPEIEDFIKAVKIEAAYQKKRWGGEHDGEKTNWDWWQLIVYLSGKAFFTNPRYPKKLLHRIITVAAAAYNWHSAQKAKGME